MKTDWQDSYGYKLYIDVEPEKEKGAGLLTPDRAAKLNNRKEKYLTIIIHDQGPYHDSPTVVFDVDNWEDQRAAYNGYDTRIDAGLVFDEKGELVKLPYEDKMLHFDSIAQAKMYVFNQIADYHPLDVLVQNRRLETKYGYKSTTNRFYVWQRPFTKFGWLLEDEFPETYGDVWHIVNTLFKPIYYNTDTKEEREENQWWRLYNDFRPRLFKLIAKKGFDNLFKPACPGYINFDKLCLIAERRSRAFGQTSSYPYLRTPQELQSTSTDYTVTFLPYAGGDPNTQPNGLITVRYNQSKQAMRRLASRPDDVAMVSVVKQFYSNPVQFALKYPSTFKSFKDRDAFIAQFEKGEDLMDLGLEDGYTVCPICGEPTRIPTEADRELYLRDPEMYSYLVACTGCGHILPDDIVVVNDAFDEYNKISYQEYSGYNSEELEENDLQYYDVDIVEADPDVDLEELENELWDDEEE